MLKNPTPQYASIRNRAPASRSLSRTASTSFGSRKKLFWKKWYSQLAFQSRQATELVVKGAALSPGMHVLDLASGSGEPALSVAAAVGPQGRVTATDLLPEMLQIAEENASARGIKNIDFRAADADSHRPTPIGSLGLKRRLTATA